MQERLLERIKHLESDSEAAAKTAVSREVNSIIEHLVRLLNTRQGSVAIAEDYGVPDMTNIPGSNIQESRMHIETTLREVIMRYEPRLKQVRLIMEDDDSRQFSLKFRLEAKLAEQEDIPVIFETVVSTDGKINVTF